jgi:hypothetical protein
MLNNQMVISMVAIHGILSMSGMCSTCALIQRDVQLTPLVISRLTPDAYGRIGFPKAVIQPAEDTLRCHQPCPAEDTSTISFDDVPSCVHFEVIFLPRLNARMYLDQVSIDIPVKNPYEITMFVGLVSHSIPLNHH